MVFLFLCIISIVEVYSASSTLTFHTDYWQPISRHIMFLLMGWGLVLITHSIPPRYFSLLGFFLPIIFLLLLAARFLGNSINNSYRWIDVVGISFQPSEMAKLSLIVFTSFLLSKKNSDNEKKIFYWILIVMGGVCAVIFLDNGSTAIMLAGIIYLMMFIGQISVRRMLILSSEIVFLGAVFYYTIKYVPYNYLDGIFPRIKTWEARFIDFKVSIDLSNSNFAITDDNYQIAHANIAVSNGQILGKGLGNSSERDFLPQAYSDFIYAIIIEETGLIGGLVVLLLYIVLFIRVGVIAKCSKKLFSMFMVMGIALALVIQALANMAVAVNLIPVTGQTLPLISRGGTSTLINCICFGIILSVSRYETIQGNEQEEKIIIHI
ncbi:MAG: FtsW/RodA/SpoVE family cell cycle protein [Bacteroidales bacterium OttesenSCG-928-I14]|nr:FtsW/RodA/SpoVE family cell cycle protein [Bacteroidales bacterium OttesenSCG-928-I14]